MNAIELQQDLGSFLRPETDPPVSVNLKYLGEEKDFNIQV
jgi:hypothetical protein